MSYEIDASVTVKGRTYEINTDTGAPLARRTDGANSLQTRRVSFGDAETLAEDIEAVRKNPTAAAIRELTTHFADALDDGKINGSIQSRSTRSR